MYASYRPTWPALWPITCVAAPNHPVYDHGTTARVPPTAAVPPPPLLLPPPPPPPPPPAVQAILNSFDTPLIFPERFPWRPAALFTRAPAQLTVGDVAARFGALEAALRAGTLAADDAVVGAWNRRCRRAYSRRAYYRDRDWWATLVLEVW